MLLRLRRTTTTLVELRLEKTRNWVIKALGPLVMEVMKVMEVMEVTGNHSLRTGFEENLYICYK